MPLTLDWIHLAALAGAVQGILLAGVLAAHRSNRTANRWLAALILTFTIYLLGFVYYSSGLVLVYPQFFGISYPLPWLFGPLVYLYLISASDGTRQVQRHDMLHFVGPAVIVLLGIPIFTMSSADKTALYVRLQSGPPPTWIRIADPLKYVSGLSYSAATVVCALRHRRSVEDSYSSTERVNLRWLLWLSGAAAAIWILAELTSASGVHIPQLRRHGDDLVALAIAAVVYAIGYMGLRQPEVFHYERPSPAEAASEIADADAAAAPVIATAPAVAPERTPAPLTLERADARYERSGLSDAEADALKKALLAVMARERPYRDPDLTLAGLAELLHTTPHKLSQVLNTEIGQTFYDFVNGHRVDDVRRRLATDDAKRLNVLTLAMDAGFASKSTFNQVFRKRTGQTPSTYRKALAG